MKKIQFLFIATFGAFFACTSGQHTGTAPALVQVSAFDTVLDGSDVSLYTLRNDSGMVVQVTNYGARVVSLWVPDAKGDFQDVVWGYESTWTLPSGFAARWSAVTATGSVRDGLPWMGNRTS